MRLSAIRTKRVPVPKDPDGGYINIVALCIEEIEEIESESVVINVGGDNQGVILSPYKKTNKTAIKCLKGWGNLFDPQGEEIKFSPSGLESIKKLSIDVGESKNVRFLEWVNREHSKFLLEIEEEKGVALGN